MTTQSPTKLVFVEDGGAAAVVRVPYEVVTHEGAAGNSYPQQVPQVGLISPAGNFYQQHVPQVVQVVVEKPSNRTRCWWFVIGVVWLLTALTQFVLAMVVRAQDIEVFDFYFAEQYHSTRSGHPWIGVLNLITSATFLVVMVGCQFNDGRPFCCGFIGAFFVGTIIISVLSFGVSFFDLDAYNALRDFDVCIDYSPEPDESYSPNPDGDCYCVGRTAPAVINASTPCENVLDYVDTILASYIFMNIVVVWSVVALVVRCCTAPRVRC